MPAMRTPLLPQTTGSRPRTVRRREAEHRAPRPPQPDPHLGARGNLILTRVTAGMLVLLLAAQGLTLFSVEGMLQPHLFIGLVLIPPLILKLGTTSYRFTRYYTGSAAYREQGPPKIIPRIIAPILVLATITLFSSGVWMLALGHKSDQAMSIHTASFVVWGIAFLIHLAVHTPTLVRALKEDWNGMLRRTVAGASTRAMLLAASFGAGLALALSLLGAITGFEGD